MGFIVMDVLNLDLTIYYHCFRQYNINDRQMKIKIKFFSNFFYFYFLNISSESEIKNYKCVIYLISLVFLAYKKWFSFKLLICPIINLIVL